MLRKTKIITSVSDMNCDEAKVIGLYKAGANILRFNFSHAEQSSVAKLLKIVDTLNKNGTVRLATLLDTKGPEIRTGDLQEKMQITKGQQIKIFVDKTLMSDGDLFCDYPSLLNDVEIDQILMIDSGSLKAKVLQKTEHYALLEMLGDHLLGSRRHINLPGVKLSLPGITEKDKGDILFAIQNDMNFIAASFVRSAANVLEIREILKNNNAEHIQIISKIENQEALENLEEIVKVSDAVMVARGDLGIEVEIATLPFCQKEIMDMCFLYGKPIIIATEMLKSMTNSSFPTRAEVSDVYNAVMLRADCTMLSDETAIGKFPFESCSMMADILKEAEKHTNNKHKDFEITFVENYALDKKMVAKHALTIADEVKADFILLFTNSGFLARIVSAFKPNQMVFAFTKDDSVYKSMSILYAIRPFLISNRGDYPVEDEKQALEMLKKLSIITSGQKIVVVNDIFHGETRSPYVKIVNID